MMKERPIDATIHFQSPILPQDAASVFKHVADALIEKGYDPNQQIVGYLVTGDPTYITSYKEARTLIRSLGRDKLLEELVRFYLVGGKE
jgi:uncharacterized protein (UPF0297 family)